MHAFFGLVIASLAIAAHSLPSTHVVGGHDAPVGKFTYQVSLRRYNRHFCGGSIINNHVILTAAHCLYGNTDPADLEAITVHAGTNLLSESGIVYRPKKAVYHENFDGYLLINDIGLIFLKSSITFTKLIQPISFATTDTAAGTPCILSGWGRTSLGGEVPNKLQELELVVYNHEKCKNALWRVGPTHICTFTKRGQGACHGDSGGPLVANGVQIGIVSFGQPCAIGYPDVFTNVAVFNSWLQKHITANVE